ncbi:MAG: UDP-N-acetylmuramoyl-tripeptide--D-alanyl-D-alanine ligase [Candidatus Moranbacteria bacterium]|nr:UDP-N-acetylmuramoyl-tripeptide--D-alanyl-D-alanine ligase [Candidatus Moranbacteria bacterium]
MDKKPRKNNANEGTEKKTAKLEKLLRFMASAMLKKYRPRIIAVTGSVGKTSAKEAIFAVISSHYRVRKSEKNYNNEIGVPLTIIGSESGEHSIFLWAGIFLRWIFKLIFPVSYPEILILELAADQPGDLKYLTDFVPPDISVITEISASHLEQFKHIEAIFREKVVPAKALSEKGLVILNIDNPYLLKLKDNPHQFGVVARIFSFGFGENADARAMDVFLNQHDDLPAAETQFITSSLSGLSFKLNYEGTTMPLRLNNILAKHNIYAALTGVSVGIELGLNLVEIGKSLENFSLPSGRMNLIRGIKNTSIIDDSYNSSLASAEGALEVLREIKQGRKIVVFGDMLELGESTENEHRMLAKKFLEIGGDVFLTVGRRMLFAVDELKKHKFSGEIYAFRNPMEAGKKLQEILHAGDVVLVKGSQGMRMEKVVEEVMAEPERAEALLCRQNTQWKATPWREV